LFGHGAIADFGDATTEYPSDGWWNGKCSSLDYLRTVDIATALSHDVCVYVGGCAECTLPQ